MRKTVQISSKIKKEYPKLNFSGELISDFQQYFEILGQWNKKMNLTAVRETEEMIYKHLLDSLAVYSTSASDLLTPPSSACVMDMGSGAGLPGILLQIANPSLRVYSVDKSKKKIGFQEFVKARLNLQNLTLLSDRIETLVGVAQLRESMDIIVSRAFDQIKDLFVYSLNFLTNEGCLILWKGKDWKNELTDVPDSLLRAFQLVESFEYRFHDTRFGGTILVFKRAF